MKQAQRAWYARIAEHFASLGFDKSPSEQILYIKKTSKVTSLIVSLYVNKWLVIRTSNDLVKDFKLQMEKIFEMSDLREMEVQQVQGGIFIS